MNKFNGVYIIAEAGVNHNGSLEMAKQLVDAAVEAGADAVKFQTFKTEKAASRKAPKADYQKQTTNAEESQFDMAKKLELDEAAHKYLSDYCKERGILFLSSAFDTESMDMLTKTFNIPILKIPSGEITNGPLLLQAAHTGKPIILSTGMSTLGEIEEALGVIAFGYLGKRENPSFQAFQSAYFSASGQAALRKNVTLLHCTSEYPVSYKDVNLKVMDTLSSAFNLPVGLSDHTIGIAVPIAAVARGACVIEKHFTLDKRLPGPDHQASLDPDELTEMVQAIRQVEEALGASVKIPTFAEMKNQHIVRKSLVGARDIERGEVFTEENVTSKRPGNGISPMNYWNRLGKKAEKAYKQDEMID